MKEYLLKLLNEQQNGLSELGYGFFTGVGFCLGVGATYLLLKLFLKGFKK